MKHILIYGGSFDPCHMGHLNSAINVQNKFRFDAVYFVPCKIPVHKKTTSASPEQRVAMLKHALLNHRDFYVDTREIHRKTPSYMVETLKSFRVDFGLLDSLTLMIGFDSFATLNQWHEWKSLFKLCHLLVINRPHNTQDNLSDELTTQLKQRISKCFTPIYNEAFGKIMFYDAGHYDVSSTWIRNHAHEINLIRPYLPEAVYQYIKENKLYQ